MFDREEDINDDDNIVLIATYFSVGYRMDAALEIVSEHIGETRTKYNFDDYH